MCRMLKKKIKAWKSNHGTITSYGLANSIIAFTNTAVEFTGPFLTKQGNGKSRENGYLCVFTCMECRAVHFEIAFGLDTDLFLNCFYKFVCRCGLPTVMVSANGSNFIGSVRELKDLYDKQSESITWWREQESNMAFYSATSCTLCMSTRINGEMC